MSVVFGSSSEIEWTGTENAARFDLFADTAADLTGLTHFDNIKILSGSRAKDISTGDKYLINSAGVWVLQPSDNAFVNVYTKTEIDGIVQGIDADITAAESDIAVLHDATERLIDTGAKNLVDAPSGSGTRFVNVPIVLQPGTYHIFFGSITSTDTDASTCQCAAFKSDNTDASNYLQLARGSDISAPLVVTAPTAYIRLYAANNYAGGAGDTVTFSDMMICTESDWNISPGYAPYCPTLAELYALVKSYHP